MKVFRIGQVLQITGLGRSSLYKQIAEGNFPKPIKLGAQSVGWIDSEVESWIAEKALQRDAKR